MGRKKNGYRSNPGSTLPPAVCTTGRITLIKMGASGVAWREAAEVHGGRNSLTSNTVPRNLRQRYCLFPSILHHVR
jgi:hypothetical protein